MILCEFLALPGLAYPSGWDGERPSPGVDWQTNWNYYLPYPSDAGVTNVMWSATCARSNISCNENSRSQYVIIVMKSLIIMKQWTHVHLSDDDADDDDDVTVDVQKSGSWVGATRTQNFSVALLIQYTVPRPVHHWTWNRATTTSGIEPLAVHTAQSRTFPTKDYKSRRTTSSGKSSEREWEESEKIILTFDQP